MSENSAKCLVCGEKLYSCGPMCSESHIGFCSDLCSNSKSKGEIIIEALDQKDAALKRLEEEVQRLKMQDRLSHSPCEICWTNSWAPVDKDWPTAQKLKNSEGYVTCQQCDLTEHMKHLEAELQAIKARRHHTYDDACTVCMDILDKNDELEAEVAVKNKLLNELNDAGVKVQKELAEARKEIGRLELTAESRMERYRYFKAEAEQLHALLTECRGALEPFAKCAELIKASAETGVAGTFNYPYIEHFFNASSLLTRLKEKGE